MADRFRRRKHDLLDGKHPRTKDEHHPPKRKRPPVSSPS
jgi:hypothetical protein